jgi:catechol 2,3-dioxygenase-like lactoylglutathione lyase family enzyme
VVLAGIVVLVASAALAEDSDSRPVIRESKFELFVGDAAASVVFYRALGFEVVHEKSHGYTTLASGGTVVALSPVPSWARFPLWVVSWLRYPPLGTELVLYVDDLGAARSALVETGYEPGDIVLQAWGDRDFRITDPDGYYIRVTLGHAIPQSVSSLRTSECPTAADRIQGLVFPMRSRDQDDRKQRPCPAARRKGDLFVLLSDPEHDASILLTSSTNNFPKTRWIMRI